MKTIFYTFPFIVLAFFAGLVVAPQPPTGAPALLGAERQLQAEKDSKKKILSENLYLQKRLGEELSIDVSLGTSKEWEEAGIAKLEELGVTPEQLIKAGSIDNALRVEAGKRNELCKI